MCWKRDPARFRLIAYDYGPPEGEGDVYRQRLRAAIPEWVQVAPMSDLEAAQRMRADGVDVAIDLKGWTQGYRAGILAHRPAPLQMQWLGFPGTMGAPWLDYIIADAVVIPPGAEAGYSEQVLRLPGCYQPNDRGREVGAMPARAALGLPDEAVVLAAFHQYYKITRDSFALWLRVLAQCPQAVLWLLDGPDSGKAVFVREAQAAGIDPARLAWAPRVAAAEHLGRLGRADLALDAFPVNAHTTASDALWAGVPQLALCGDSFVSRVSASIVSAAGLSQLVAADAAGYEALVLELVRTARGARPCASNCVKRANVCPCSMPWRLPVISVPGWSWPGRATGRGCRRCISMRRADGRRADGCLADRDQTGPPFQRTQAASHSARRASIIQPVRTASRKAVPRASRSSRSAIRRRSAFSHCWGVFATRTTGRLPW